MGQRPTARFSMGDHCLVAFLLCSSLLVQVDCSPFLARQWSLEQLAWDFCKAVAGIKHTNCTCVDTLIIREEGSKLCGSSKVMGPGLGVMETSFRGFQGDLPQPNKQTLQKECDARNGTTDLLGCNITTSRSVKSQPEIITNVSLGIDIMLQISLPSLADPPASITITFQHSPSISDTTIFNSSTVCGPFGSLQPAGTCEVYTEISQSYTLQNQKFAYDVDVMGGVQMKFSTAIDALDAIKQANNGPHQQYWWLNIAQIVSFGQSSAGNLVNAKQFGSPSPQNLKYQRATFHGLGYLSGQFVDKDIYCSATPCSD